MKMKAIEREEFRTLGRQPCKCPKYPRELTAVGEGGETEAGTNSQNTEKVCGAR